MLWRKTAIIGGMLDSAKELFPKTQLLTNEISNPRVLAAIGSVSREHYVPENLSGVAYVDEELPLIPGRYMLEPLIFARLLQAADIQPHETVLDIGCGLGYGAAVLSKLARHVTAVETNPELVDGARKALMKEKRGSVEVIAAELAQGSAMNQPYNVILIEGAVQSVPERLLAQLDEGGRLVAVRNIELRPGTRLGLGYIVIMEKIDGSIVSKKGIQASAALLPGFERIKTFRF